jgi:hypothetical protein
MRKAGTAAGRSNNVEPSKKRFSGDGQALTPSARLLAQDNFTPSSDVY